MEELGLFGAVASTLGEYTVFQDESGVRSSDRWLILGFLFVPTTMVASLTAVLDQTRRSRAAMRWMREYRAGWHKNSGFTALAIDTHKIDPATFPTRFYLQNRFCVMALKLGIACHILPEKIDKLELHVVYDRHDIPVAGKTGLEDNYETYLGPRLEQAVADPGVTQAGNKYPILTVNSVVPQDSAACLPLQLTDLLLGAFSQAVTHGSNQATKSRLGLAATHWCMDVSKSPWLQELGMYRKLNLRGFPDEHDQTYDLVNAVQESQEDSSLFSQ
jgi:hypothetical protein